MTEQQKVSPRKLDELPVRRAEWSAFLHGDELPGFESLLPAFLVGRRWFGGKAQKIVSATVAESVAVPHDGTESYLALIEVRYDNAKEETYLLGLSFAEASEAQHVLGSDLDAALLRLQTSRCEGIVYDAVRDRGFVIALLDSIDRESHFESADGTVEAIRTEKFGELRNAAQSVEPRVMGAEQSNTSIVFGERMILKLFRRVESGLNPDFEIGRFLTEHGFFNTPPVAGAIEMSSPGEGDEPRTLGILQGFVPNKGDAWKFTLESLRVSVQRALARESEMAKLQVPDESLLENTDAPPAFVQECAGDYLDAVRLLGRRTAELHLTLDSSDSEENFAPERFSSEYQRSIYGSMRRMARGIIAIVRNQMDQLPDAAQKQARELLSRETELYDIYHIALESVFDAERNRIHGDYHLGQVLYTGSDFVIIDFEGEPLRPIRERRIKRSPLRDVAGMLRSFDYAGHSVLMETEVEGSKRHLVERFCQVWVAWVSAAFLHSYLETCDGARFLPSDQNQTAAMLDLFLLDKAVYELGYEVNNRPTWVGIPVSGILQILDQRAGSATERRRRVA